MTTKAIGKIDEKNPLPSSWRWVKLGKVIREAQAGFACGLRDPQGIAQLRMNNLDTRGSFVWDDVLRVPHAANDIEQFLILPGDVLFNNTNSTELVGKSALFEGYVEPIVYSNHFTRLRTVTEALLPDFLASWLNHKWQQGVFATICNRWIGQSAVKADKLLTLDFPLPPLPEQRRIAGVLHEQMAAVEKARAAAQARLEAVKTLPAAFLRQVFPQPGQPLLPGWRWVRLGEVLQETRNGLYKPDTYYGTGTRILKMFNIGRLDGAWDLSRLDFIELTEKESAAYRLEEGDILFNRVNSNELVGKCAVVDSHTAGAVYESKNMRLRLDSAKACSHFAATFLNSSGGRNQIEKRLKQIVGQATVNRSDLDSLEIPLPPLAEQRRIAGVLRQQMAVVEMARTAAEEELQTINALPAALLRRAFNGEV